MRRKVALTLLSMIWIVGVWLAAQMRMDILIGINVVNIFYGGKGPD